MNNEEKIDKINRWQTSGYVHELTCGNDTCDGVLEAKIENDEVILFCPECNDYEQNHIPETIFEFDIDAHEKYIKEMAKKGAHVVVIGSVDIIQTEKDGTKYNNVKIIVDELHISKKSANTSADESNMAIANEVFS